MRKSSLILILLLVPVVWYGIWSSYHTTEKFTRMWTVDDPASADARNIDWKNESDFIFTWGDGSGWEGYDTVKLRSDGTVAYVFRDHTRSSEWKWKRPQFSLEGDTVRELRDLLAAIDYFSLKQQYHAAIMDGTQRFVKVEISGKRKGVYCNNNFPIEILRIKSFVEKRILAVHSVQIALAKTTSMTRESMETEMFSTEATTKRTFK